MKHHICGVLCPTWAGQSAQCWSFVLCVFVARAWLRLLFCPACSWPENNTQQCLITNRTPHFQNKLQQWTMNTSSEFVIVSSQNHSKRMTLELAVKVKLFWNGVPNRLMLTGRLCWRLTNKNSYLPSSSPEGSPVCEVFRTFPPVICLYEGAWWRWSLLYLLQKKRQRPVMNTKSRLVEKLVCNY